MGTTCSAKASVRRLSFQNPSSNDEGFFVLYKMVWVFDTKADQHEPVE